MASIYQRQDSPFLWMSYKSATGQWRHGRTRFLKDSIEERQKAQEAAKRKSLEEKLPKRFVDQWEVTDKKLQTILAELCSLPGEGFFVYLLKSGDLLKVGKTFQLRNRMANYRSHSPGYRLLGVRAFKNAEQVNECERMMKVGFKAFLHDGKEWFKDAAEIRKEFAQWDTGQLLYLNLL